MEGRSRHHEEVAPCGDIFVTATGNIDVITLKHMREMKDRSIVYHRPFIQKAFRRAATKMGHDQAASR